MTADYKNWVPKGMIYVLLALSALTFTCLVVFGICGIAAAGTGRIIAGIVSAAAFAPCALFTAWAINAYCAFSYKGKRQLSRRIIQGTAEYVSLPQGGRGLDVGCGSGALTIACAKKNPHAFMTGLDRWGKEYASFNKPLCEKNAAAEGVSNTDFVKGNAIKLDYKDETFDAVTSNYVYHNIPVADRQQLLLETLRVLKKGGTFAIHDLMSSARYGDMQAFIENLKKQGYEKAELIDTAQGLFMTPAEAKMLMLSGSTLLAGKK